MTAFSNSALAVNAATGEVAYPAGCIAVIYAPRRNRQVRFFKSRQAISCVTFSSDGRFIAVGEKGKNPAVRVWELGSGKTLAELHGHKFGVTALAFSPDSRYLVSAGFRHDRSVNLWEWRAKALLGTAKSTTKVHGLAFAEDGRHFVTCGHKHVRFWPTDAFDGLAATPPAEPAELDSKLGTLNAGADETFVDVACGRGAHASLTFAITSKGTLCGFDDTCVMDMWVNVQSAAAFSLSVSEGIVVVGCADGIIRAFEPDSFNFVATLPQPPAVGRAATSAVAGSADPTGSAGEGGVRPAALCLRLSADQQKLVSVYGDRSLFVWDIKRLDRVAKYRAFIHHSAPIWDVAVLPPAEPGEDGIPPLPEGTFVTCAADSTVRFWNLDKMCLASGGTTDAPVKGRRLRVSDVPSPWRHLHNFYSRELLYVMHADSADAAPGPGDASVAPRTAPDARELPPTCPSKSWPVQAVITGPVDAEIPPLPDMNVGLRCMSVHPAGDGLAVGDREGNVRIYDLRSMSLDHLLPAHDSEVMSVCFAPSSGSLVASGSRDRLVHIFDARRSFALATTRDNHSAAVTSVLFSNDDERFLSCAGDQKLVFSRVDLDATPESGELLQTLREVNVSSGTIYDMQVDAMNRSLLTAGQDKKLNIWNMTSGKPIRSYAADAGCQELNRVVTDPAGILAVTCSFDKAIRMYDFYEGRRLSRVTAHSEMVTGLAFTHDCRRMISVGGDGCIMVWRLAPELTTAMRERLSEIKSTTRTPAGSASAAGPGRSASAPALATAGNSAPKPSPTAMSVVPAAMASASQSVPAEAATRPATPERGQKPRTGGDAAAFSFRGTGLPAWAKEAHGGDAPLQGGGIRTGGFSHIPSKSEGVVDSAAATSAADAGGAAAGARPSSRWASRVGSDGYDLFGGATRVQPPTAGDAGGTAGAAGAGNAGDEEDAVLMGSEDDAAGPPADGDDEEDDGGGAGDDALFMSPEAAQKRLDRTSFEVTRGRGRSRDSDRGGVPAGADVDAMREEDFAEAMASRDLARATFYDLSDDVHVNPMRMSMTATFRRNLRPSTGDSGVGVSLQDVELEEPMRPQLHAARSPARARARPPVPTVPKLPLGRPTTAATSASSLRLSAALTEPEAAPSIVDTSMSLAEERAAMKRRSQQSERSSQAPTVEQRHVEGDSNTRKSADELASMLVGRAHTRDGDKAVAAASAAAQAAAAAVDAIRTQSPRGKASAVTSTPGAPLPSPASPTRPGGAIDRSAPPPPPAAESASTQRALPRPRAVYESAAASLRSALEQSLTLLAELNSVQGPSDRGAAAGDEVAETVEMLHSSLASAAVRMSSSAVVPASVRSQAGSVAGWGGGGAESVGASVASERNRLFVAPGDRPGVISIGMTPREGGQEGGPQSPRSFARRAPGDMVLESISTVGGAESAAAPAAVGAAPPVPPAAGAAVELNVEELLERYSSMLCSAFAEKMSGANPPK